MRFTKNDYEILYILKNADCTTEFKSYTITAIQEEIDLSYQKIRRTLINSIILNYVKKGAKQHRKDTYYITERGINKLKEIGD